MSCSKHNLAGDTCLNCEVFELLDRCEASSIEAVKAIESQIGRFQDPGLRRLLVGACARAYLGGIADGAGSASVHAVVVARRQLELALRIDPSCDVVEADVDQSTSIRIKQNLERFCTALIEEGLRKGGVGLRWRSFCLRDQVKRELKLRGYRLVKVGPAPLRWLAIGRSS